MAPNRFTKDRKARDVTPYRGEPAPASIIPLRPTTPHPDRQPSPFTERPVTPAPPEWTSVDAPINFTWVIPEELCGMGWPKSRDQVRFLVEQGIDHLVSLSPEKIPPHYAFPNLKHTLIPVEDFTGPTIAEIQKFLEITDEARKEGEAVGVHCAEGRGRTGVMCACYLIYYYDMEPWDAIRIMRRQRPGSVERKVQEETVVRFYTILQDYGKSSVDNLEEREKQLVDSQKRQQAELIRRDGMVAHQATMNLLNHMHSFHHKQTNEAKQERESRLRRARSTPKLEDEEEMNAAKLKNHIQSLLQGDRQRSKSQLRIRDEEDGSDNDRRSRATTPGRLLLEEVSLKPVGERNIKGRLEPPPTSEKCELKNHFRDFMKTTPAMVKRGRSFSQPRDKEKWSENESLSRKDSFEQKYVQDRLEQEKCELRNHTQRFLKRKSLINPNKTSDESDNDSLVKDKPVEKDNRDVTPSDNDVEDSSTNIVASKPPPFKTTAETKLYRRVRNRNRDGEDGSEEKPSRRFDRRLRSKSDITVPKCYDMSCEGKGEYVDDYKEVEIKQTYSNGLEQSDKTVPKCCDISSEDKDEYVDDYTEVEVKQSYSNGLEQSETNENSEGQDENLDTENKNSATNLQTEDLSEITIADTADRPRIRKINLNSNNEYCYVSTNLKVLNSNPKPFVSSPTTVEEKITFPSPPDTQQLFTGKEQKVSDRNKEPNTEERKTSDKSETFPAASLGHYSSSTSEIMNACKSGLRRLTYRKTYSRTRSCSHEKDQDNNNNNNPDKPSENSPIVYTQLSSGTRLPNRPTTPGPYLNSDRNFTSEMYRAKRPTTPGPFNRDSWKRTNQKFNYSRILNCSGQETFV